MPVLSLPEDFGFTTVQLGTAAPIRIHLWSAMEAYNAAVQRHADKGDGRWDDVRKDFAEWLATQGLSVDPLVGDTVAGWVFNEVADLKKKEPSSLSANSPSSTASTPSPSPTP